MNAARAGAVVAVLALVGAGCSSSEPTAREAPASSTSTSTSTTAPRVGTGESGDIQVIAATATGTSPCEQASPTPASPGQVGAGGEGSESNTDGAGHGARGMVQQLPLTHAQRLELQAQMEQARAVAAQYPTVATAVAAGYDPSTPYVPCIGAHYTDVQLAIGFDPSRPSELLYDGNAPDSKIVGLSYLVYHHDGPPPGFAGANDHWHQHNTNGGLCLAGGFVVGGEDMSPQRCADAGGRKTLLLDVWMMHTWAVPGFECSWGVFSGECPELGGRLGGTAWETPEPAKKLSGDSAKTQSGDSAKTLPGDPAG